MRLEPLDYQVAGLDSLRAGFRAGKRAGLLVMLMGPEDDHRDGDDAPRLGFLLG